MKHVIAILAASICYLILQLSGPEAVGLMATALLGYTALKILAEARLLPSTLLTLLGVKDTSITLERIQAKKREKKASQCKSGDNASGETVELHTEPEGGKKAAEVIEEAPSPSKRLRELKSEAQPNMRFAPKWGKSE